METTQTTATRAREIPDHLKEFVVEQNPQQYLAIDHAVWRYILRQLKNYLSKHAHDSYLDGLTKTGITVEQIPSIESISQKLQAFGWCAVPVSGFIPPAAFMEMQSLGILPIASDMRSIDHILYTPAPDIVHEAAGHAPMLAHPDFARYLKQYASVAKNAIVSNQDLALYEAIRELSDIKENPTSTAQEIKDAEKKLSEVTAALTVTSEATWLGRMNWWTAEYGLIGDIANPKIYGAGLLSSYGEAKECLKDKVKKYPLTVDCIEYSYDITEPQPQLFVAKDFANLTQVLGELAQKMAYKMGGTLALDRAIEAKTVNTVQLNSGIQISGMITEYIEQDGNCVFVRTTGPTQLSLGNCELPGHSKDYHNAGYSTPVGFIKGYQDCLSWASTEDIAEMGLIEGERCSLHYESGIHVEGRLLKVTRSQRRELCLLTFEDCHVTHGEQILFAPDWGLFDLAVGSKVSSVFSGPADRKNYGLIDSFAKKKVPARKLSTQETRRNEVYAQIRELRIQKKIETNQLQSLHATLNKELPDEWLARLELVELSLRHSNMDSLTHLLREELTSLAQRRPDFAEVIDDGLKIAHLEV